MYSNKYDRLVGKWGKKQYMLIKKLGSGGIGEIYLVEDSRGDQLALKVSDDLVSITKEYNYLKKLQSKEFVPRVYELDDFEKEGKNYHYFTMEYIEGYTLKNAIKGNMLSLKTKLGLICLIARIIKEINDEGYVYTDLKYENIMVDRKNGLIRLVDMGSLVQTGGTVKEYTPMYDRAAWGKGRRIADLYYQTFVIGVLFISMLLGRSLDPDKEKLDTVVSRLKKEKLPGKVYDIIGKCLDGKIDDCERLCNEIKAITIGKFMFNRRFNAILNIVIIILALVLVGTVCACM